MMNFDLIAAFVSDYTAHIVSMLYVAGVALLLVSLRGQSRQLQQNAQAMTALQIESADNDQARRQMTAELEQLREQCLALSQRQDLLERRAPDARRIDRAVRIVKRGAGDQAILHDMGLSDGEARLLLRLHGDKGDDKQRAIKPPAQKAPLSAQARALANAMSA